jgi:Tol biopolymer transport system component
VRLASGTRIGPFEITGPLGAGGMGEVYRARDTSLGRDVALKVLPESVAHDPERLGRFEREARTLAALNHPHIAQIHGFETSGGTPALVMEYVDGPALDERIGRGPVPIDEAVAIARQVADALEAAHSQGIVHRDLKPANIKVRPDGTVKVLDFGLAKALDSTVSASGAVVVSQSPTTTSPAMMTGAGIILGTAPYMSPEQAKGRRADQQSDIWAFGCLLYEMLTGQRAFRGDDVADTIAAVLRGEPDWRALPAEVPLGVTLVLRRCLARDRRERLHHIGDARLLFDGPFAVEGEPRSAASPKLRRRELAAWVLAAVMVALLVAVWWFRGNEGMATTSRQVTRFTVTPPENVELIGGGNQITSLLSPDGRKLVYIGLQGGTQAIWIQDFSKTQPDRIPQTERAVAPFWSPDSRSIAFFADGDLRTLALETNSVRILCPAVGLGGTWNTDDLIVFAHTNDGRLFRVPASGGTPEAITDTKATPNATSHRYPAFLPDGRRFVFQAFPLNQLWLGSLDSPDVRMVLAAESQGLVLPSGRILYVRQGTLFVQPFDLDRAVAEAEPQPLETAILSVPSGYSAYSASASGHLVYRTGQVIQPTQLTWTDRTGKVVGLVGKPDLYRNPALSPDGIRLAIQRTDESRRLENIWLFDLTRGVLSRFLTADAQASATQPVWSPDSKRIAFAMSLGGTANLYEKTVDSSAAEELLLEAKGIPVVPYSWSPDGRFILHRLMNGPFYNTGVLALSGDRTPRLYAPRDHIMAMSSVSPDGKYVAYNANDSGRFEVYIESFPEPGTRWQVSRDGGVHPRWRPDGRALYYYAADETLTAVPINPTASQPVGASIPLFRERLLSGPTVSIGFMAQYAVASDGRFLLNVPIGAPPPPVIQVALNRIQ